MFCSMIINENPMKMKRLFLIIILLSCVSLKAQTKALFGPADYVRALKRCTDIMVNDVTSPVAASRYYAYITISANEVLSIFKPAHPAISGSIREFRKPVIADSIIKKSNPALASILCIYKTGARLLPSGHLMKQPTDSVIKLAAKKLSADIIDNTVQLVDSVVAHMIRYANTDGFRKLSGMKRYTPTTGDGYWQPTAPAFMSALEPYWGTLRSFALDSANQFKPERPADYSKDSGSIYFELLREVYVQGKAADKNKQEIAMFWDCNPFALQQMGHLEFGLKKISPGGHWMGITGIACVKAKASLEQTSYTHAITAIALADAFISCWDEKYRSNRVRPETGIKRLIDPLWQPLLQTPPFPEYPSGHSVISAAAATVLTKIFGENFSYTDDTEYEFGLAPRKFSSFKQAAEEAAISRLYGGIHYRDAIENGIKEGIAIGQWVISKFGNEIAWKRHP
jgi:hypothetical protein